MMNPKNVAALARVGRWITVAVDLGKIALEAIGRNEPARVDAILPDELLTTLAKRLADARAAERFPVND